MDSRPQMKWLYNFSDESSRLYAGGVNEQLPESTNVNDSNKNPEQLARDQIDE